MQAYRGLPILTNQPARPTPARRHLAARARGLRRRVPAARARTRSTRCSRRGGRRSSPAAPASTSARRSRSSAPAGARRRALASAGGLLYDESGAERPTRPRRAGSRRCRRRAPERPPARCPGSRAHRRRRVAGAPEPSRLWTEDTRHPTLVVGLDVPAETVAGRIDARTRAMVERGVEEEAAAALARALSSTARKVIGLEEFETFPPKTPSPRWC